MTAVIDRAMGDSFKEDKYRLEREYKKCNCEPLNKLVGCNIANRVIEEKDCIRGNYQNGKSKSM